MDQVHKDGGVVIDIFPDMIARGFSYVPCPLSIFHGDSTEFLTDLCSRAYITDSVLHRLELDSIIDHIAPDAS